MTDTNLNANYEQTLSELLNLSIEMIDFCQEVVIFCHKTETQFIEGVCGKILAKSMNDLLSINYLIRSGLSIQAATVASSLQEAIGFFYLLPKTNEAANQYWRHDKTKSIKELTLGKGFVDIASSFGISEDSKESLRDFYEFFCQAKHNNPILLKQFHGKIDELKFGPDMGETSVATGCITLHTSIGFLLRGVQVFLENFTSEYATTRRKNAIRQKFHAIGERSSQIVSPHVPEELRESSWLAGQAES